MENLTSATNCIARNLNSYFVSLLSYNILSKSILFGGGFISSFLLSTLYILA